MIKIILLFWFIIILISCLSLVGLLCIILHAWVWKSLKPYLSLRKEFIPVNLRISKVPSYWRWSLLLKSGSFSDVPSYSRTPLIRDSRVCLWAGADSTMYTSSTKHLFGCRSMKKERDGQALFCYISWHLVWWRYGEKNVESDWHLRLKTEKITLVSSTKNT